MPIEDLAILGIEHEEVASQFAAHFQLLRAARGRSPPPALELELDMAKRAIRFPDLIEGVRASLLDEHRRPRWSQPVNPRLLPACPTSFA